MKIPTKTRHSCSLAAFTLVELTIVLLVGILIATMALTLFSFQLATYRIVQTQNFLIHEAPQINNSLNRIVARANFFRLYGSLGDAESNANAVIADANVMALQFNGTGDTPDSFGVIHFDNTTNQLNYYHLQNLADLQNSTPEWTISDQVNDTVFFVENGVLRTRLIGPNGGQIVHSTTTQR